MGRAGLIPGLDRGRHREEARDIGPILRTEIGARVRLAHGFHLVVVTRRHGHLHDFLPFSHGIGLDCRRRGQACERKRGGDEL